MTGVVHKDVDATELLSSLGDKVLVVFRFCDIGLDSNDFHPFSSDLLGR